MVKIRICLTRTLWDAILKLRKDILYKGEGILTQFIEGTVKDKEEEEGKD